MTQAPTPFEHVPARAALQRQLLRLAVYYAGLAAALLLLNATVPNFLDHLPIGGVSTITGNDPATLALEDAFARRR